jgi:hypothetical protein
MKSATGRATFDFFGSAVADLSDELGKLLPE